MRRKIEIQLGAKTKEYFKNEVMFAIQIIKGHLSCQKIVQARFTIGKSTCNERVLSNEFEHNIS